MQCTSCGFENIPGSQACGRCGSSMQVGTMVMDVAPPRASGWRKSVRRNLPTGRRLYQHGRYGAESVGSGAAFAGAQGAALAGRAIAEMTQVPRKPIHEYPAMQILPRALIPGCVQIFCGQTVAGVVQFIVFLLMLCAAFANMESFGGSLIGMAFGVHASGVVRIVIRYFRPRTRALRFLYGMATALILVVFLYIPAAFILAWMMHVRVRWTWMV